MSATVLAVVLLAAFAALSTLSDRLRGGWRVAPLVVFAAGLALAGVELARWDHGHPDWLLWIGWVGAPVVVIFGAAAAGARRFYGWPDLGPAPGRLALVATALLAGVLVGSRLKVADVEATMRRGESIATDLRAWRDAHAGTWPRTLAETLGSEPATSLGAFSPPGFRWDGATGSLSFPVRTGTDLVLDASKPGATWAAR